MLQGKLWEVLLHRESDCMRACVQQKVEIGRYCGISGERLARAIRSKGRPHQEIVKAKNYRLRTDNGIKRLSGNEP